MYFLLKLVSPRSFDNKEIFIIIKIDTKIKERNILCLYALVVRQADNTKMPRNKHLK